MNIFGIDSNKWHRIDSSFYFMPVDDYCITIERGGTFKDFEVTIYPDKGVTFASLQTYVNKTAVYAYRKNINADGIKEAKKEALLMYQGFKLVSMQ